MRTLLSKIVILGLIGSLGSSAALASAPSFVVRCMRTSGPVSETKYGTYYFFLKEGQVKGSTCSVPGNPCQIINRSAQIIIFQTPGENPDTLTIDLRTGAVYRTAHNGLQWTYACRQIR